MTSKFKLLHITDPHLNFSSAETIQRWCANIISHKPNAIVITGDIAESHILVDHLDALETSLGKTFPIFFVLGNHDFYRGSISAVQATMKRLYTYENSTSLNLEPELGWLDSSGVIRLTEKCALIGAGGWWDGGYANWFKSQLDMNDYYLIKELSGPVIQNRQERFDKLQLLSAESADYVRRQLQAAFDAGYKTVYVATHVPPFKESSVYNGKISDDTWLPHFSSKKMGEALTQVCLANPDKQATVLCGHTHGTSTYLALKNLTVLCGAAEYGNPGIANIINI